MLVIDTPKPKDCAVPRTVVDVFDRWRNGAYALYIDRTDDSPEPHVRLETVAAHRGERPWSSMPERKQPALPKPHIRENPAPGGPPSSEAQTAQAETAPRTSADEDPGEGVELEMEDRAAPDDGQ